MIFDEDVSERLSLYSLPQDLRKRSLAYAAFLFKNLRDGAYGPPPDDPAILCLFKDFELEECPTWSQLEELFDYLKKNELIMQCGCIAMLAYLPPEDHKYADAHQALQALSLAAYLSLGIKRDETVRDLETFAKRVRRIVQAGSQNWVLAHIEGAVSGLDPLIGGLEEALIARKSSPPVPGQNIERLEELLSGLTWYRLYLEEQLSTRTFLSYQSRNSVADPEIRILSGPVRVDGIEINEPEASNDYPIDSVFVQDSSKVVSPISASYPLLFNQASKIVNSIAINNICPPCHWSRLSDHEIKSFLNAVEESIESPPNCWLALLLCSGRSTAQLKAIFPNAARERQDNIRYVKGDRIGLSKSGNPYISSDYITPEPKGFENYSSLYIQPTEKLVLPLPAGLFTGIRNLLSLSPEELDDAIEQAEKICSEISSTQHRLTPTRLARHLPTRLRDAGIDPTEIAMICGQSLTDNAGLYYYSTSLESIVNLYQKQMNEIFTSAKSRLGIQIDLRENYKVGSKSIPKRKAVVALYREQMRIVVNLKKRRIPDFKHFHNEYMIYAYEALNLCVGYRAVNAPLECITDYDLDRRIAWVSDKESRNGLSARIVPLCQTAIEIIEAVLSHLHCLSQYTKPFSTATSDFLSKSTIGDAPLLSIFDPTTGRIGRLEPRKLSRLLALKWPLPQNWQRHFMRTELRRAGASGELVNAWMGHNDFGEESLGPWSGLSLADLHEVSNAIEDIVQSLGILPASGWDRAW